MRYLPLSVAVAGLLACGTASAAVEITAEMTQTADGKTTPLSMYITADRMKVDMDRSAMIYRQDTGKFINVMKAEHEYMEFDPKAIAAEMNAAEQMMQERLQSMPPEQRKQIEAMMAKHGHGMMGTGGAAPTISYQKTGETKKVGAWTCQVFHEMVNGELTADACIAPLGELGLTEADLAVFKSFSDTMRKSLPPHFRGGSGVMDLDTQTREIGYAGLPVESVTYVEGKPRSTTIVKTVGHGAPPPGTFEVPAGYTKKEMPAFGRPGGPPH